jgi:hypothetical protein
MLTFAGQELLFPTAELDAWMARNQELCDLSQFAAEPARLASGRHACRSRFEQNKGLGLPIINWPAPPVPRLNTLYWPTGATRWAMGWFVARGDALDKIIAKTRSAGRYAVKGTLGIGDDLDQNTDTPVHSIDMYMLPPRPMTRGGESGRNLNAWLVPLVDERYFWQFNNLGDYEVTTSTTWANLFSRIGTQLGITIDANPSVPSAYLKPDPVDFTRRFDNVALLLDAAAWSIGRRIVRTIDGSVSCQNTATADGTFNENRSKPRIVIAGGDFGSDSGLTAAGGDLPSALTLTFRKIKQFLLRSNGQLYTLDKTATDGTVTVQNRKLTIHCAAYADYDTSDVLQNGTALDNLAKKIRDDYYAWAARDYDVTYSGVTDYKPSGYDDAILWSFGRLCADKCLKLVRDDEGKGVDLAPQTEYLAYTRVQTLPGNTWPEINLCSDSTKEVIEPRQLGKPTRDIPGGETDEVTIWNGPAGSETVTSPAKKIQVTNRGSADLPADNFAWLEGINDAQWYGGCYEQ